MTMSDAQPRTAARTVVTLKLPTDVTAPAIARHAVRDALADLGLSGPQAEDILLATSELVTNAVEHGERPERLELDLNGERLVLRVYDAGAELPELKPSRPSEARRRGLHLVQTLAAEWGHRRSAFGKYVWAAFVFAKPAH